MNRFEPVQKLLRLIKRGNDLHLKLLMRHIKNISNLPYYVKFTNRIADLILLSSYLPSIIIVK